MDKDLMIQYAKILNKLEEFSGVENPIEQLSQEEKDIIDRVRNLSKYSEKVYQLYRELRTVPANEREKLVENSFAEDVTENQNDEEVIAKTFGIDVSKIQHKYLSNGKEVFCFYSNSLGREVVLNNDQKGKPLITRLKEVQEEYEQFQTEDNVENASDILMDEGNRKNLELEFLPKNGAENRLMLNGNLSEQDKKKIAYLLTHYDRLHIIGINVENALYMDANYEIHEAVLDKEENVVITSPSEEHGEQSILEEEKYVAEESKESMDEKVEEVERDPNEEGLIVSVFGVNPDEIQHKFLSDGKEIICFYSVLLGKEIVLNASCDGKTLIDYLKGIQVAKEMFPLDGVTLNLQNLLSEQNDNQKFILEFLPKEEVANQLLLNIDLKDEDLKKFDYLLENYERLNIRGINLEKNIFVNENNEVREIAFNKEHNIVVLSPGDEAEKKEVVEEAKSNIGESSIEMEENHVSEQKEKPKILMKKQEDNKPTVSGFTDGLLLISITVSVLLLVGMSYLFVRLLFHF